MADYIDRQKLINDFRSEGCYFVYGDYVQGIVSRIRLQPVLDPEELPIVQELREQVKEQKEQLSHLEYWELDRKQVLKSAAADRAAVKVMRKRCEQTIAELREELKQVKAERDAAVSDLKVLADCDYCANDCKNWEVDECRLCGVDGRTCRTCRDGSNWEWRGPVEESEGKDNG